MLLCTAPVRRCSEGPFPSGFQLGLTNGRCLEKALAPHSSTLLPGKSHGRGSLSQTRLSNFTFTFHFHALEKEMATHSRVPAWRIPGMGEPGGLPSMGLHRVAHDWSDLAAAGAWRVRADHSESFHVLISSRWLSASFHLRWHLLPRGSLPTATWLPGHLLPLPRPERCHNGTPLFPTLVLHSGHVSFPEFHHLLVKRFFTKPSSGSVCHLFPLRTSMDAINKETRLLMNHLCRQNYGPLFRSS